MSFILYVVCYDTNGIIKFLCCFHLVFVYSLHVSTNCHAQCSEKTSIGINIESLTNNNVLNLNSNFDENAK